MGGWTGFVAVWKANHGEVSAVEAGELGELQHLLVELLEGVIVEPETTLKEIPVKSQPPIRLHELIAYHTPLPAKDPD